MLKLSSLSLATPDKPLLDTVDAILVDGDIVGLVGPNGSGKSTLLRALLNGTPKEVFEPYYSITSGRIHGSHSIDEREPGSVLLVDQDILSWSSLFPGIGTEEEIRNMTVPDALDMAIAVENIAADEDKETWRRLNIAASAVGWGTANYNTTPISVLSPGSALRAYLAVAMHRPSIELLFMDEPTNHLDLPSILWLQHTIRESGKTFIIVSHDETFLDAVVTKIWEIGDDDSLTVSSAKYSDYKHAKMVAIENQRRAYDDQQHRNEQLTTAITKLKVATKRGEFFDYGDASKLQKKFKRDRAGRSGRKAAALETFRDSQEVVEQVIDHAPLQLRFDPLGHGIDSSIQIESVILGFGRGTDHETALPLPPISLRVDFGERVALIGYNGVGKSTLLQTITRNFEPISGTVSIGRDLRIGSLMQEHQSLPRDITPRDHIAALCGLSRFAAGTRVISYGLTIHQVDSPISELNPGARARLLLATFAIRRVNVLILDEPTNHLDEEAIHEVIASINVFEGTVFVVSHDRSLLNEMKLTRFYRLSAEGLSEIESVEHFVEDTEPLVEKIVIDSFK